MANKTWQIGRICLRDEEVNLDQSILIAEVQSRALRSDDGGLAAAYILAHHLEADEADRAMMYFSANPDLLIDASRLAEDAGAEFPALVTIRQSPDAAGYLATVSEYGVLRMLPDDNTVSRDGWDIFCARDAMLRGVEVDEAEPLQAFDYRSLRRKVYAARALTQEDRSPWLVEEYQHLRAITANNPEGSEAFIAMADDMEAALNGEVDIGAGFSVVIPTRVERVHQDGAMRMWMPQVGREIVIAHGLNAVQAARALLIVTDNPSAFVSEADLLSSAEARETVCPPFITADAGLNWISTDFSGRRCQAGYEILQDKLIGTREVVEAQIFNMSQQSAGR